MTTMTNDSTDTRLMTPAEVAAVFRVDVKTVTRWANAGKLTSIRTLGGHRRFRESEVMALMQGTLVAGPIPQQFGRTG
jgi:excisionase family DNA binding protein